MEFFPHRIPFSKVKLKDFLTQAASDIVTLLTNPPNTSFPSLDARDPLHNALLKISTALHQVANIPKPIQQSTDTIPPTKAPKHHQPPLGCMTVLLLMLVTKL